MKHLYPFLVTMFVLPAACGNDAEASRVREKAGETLDAIHNYTQKEIREMNTSLKKSWADLKAEAEKLEIEAKSRGEQVSQSVKDVLATAEQKADAAREKLSAAGEAGSDAAEDSMANAKEAYEDAKESLAKAWAELRK